MMKSVGQHSYSMEIETLRAENEILKATIENLGVGIGVANSKGEIVSFNKAALRLHGFVSEEEILSDINQYMDEFELYYSNGNPIPFEDWPLPRAMRGDFVTDYETKLVRRKPYINKYVKFTFTPVYGEFGNLELVVYSMTDITEFKRAEENLKNERELFEGIFNNIPVLITIYDPSLKDFRFNNEMKRVLGWTEDDASTGDLLEKVYPNPDVRREVIEYMQSLKPGWKEFIATSKDGQQIDTAWANIFLKSGVQIGIGIDIRERKRAEEKILETGQRLQAIFNNAAIGIVEIDTETRFVFVNNRVCEILGYQRETLLQKSIMEITAPEDKEISRLYYDSLLKGEINILNYEKRYVKPDGSLIWAHVSISAIRQENGQLIKSIGTIKDITERKEAEHSLRSHATEIEAILSCIPDGVLVYNKKGSIVRSNSVAEKFMGYPDNEKDDSIADRLNKHYKVWAEDGRQLAPEEMPAFRTAIKAETVTNEILMLEGHGHSRWYIFNGAPLIVAGEHMGAVVSMLDITTRKLVEERLKENEQRLIGMFNNAAIGIVEVDSHDRFIAVNNRICEILGYPAEELLGKSVSEITYPEDRSQSDKMNELLYRGHFNMFKYEKRYLKKDKTPIWVNVSVSAIRDSKGKHTRSIGTIEDISERKKYEDALRESEEMFSTMFEAAPVGISLANIEGILYNVNKVWLDITGHNIKEDVIGKTVMDLGVLGSKEHQEKILDKLSRDEALRNYEIAIISKKGGCRYVNVSIDQVQVRGSKFLLSTLEDISDQKKSAQEIIHKNEELTRFVYTVSHDLKSPLVTIKSFSAFLKSDIETNDHDAISRGITYIQNAADKMGRLLDELLELSRIGRKEESKTEVPLGEVAQAAIDLVAGRINAAKVTVRMVGSPVMLYGYYQRLVQLYQNLIDNAVKFMGSQPNPLIEIGTSIERDNIVLFVRDNGIGIDPRYHHKLFGLFEKLDNSKEGTGIGLALVKRIVEVHNGSIWFESEGAGKGTAFYFTLSNTRLI